MTHAPPHVPQHPAGAAPDERADAVRAAGPAGCGARFPQSWYLACRSAEVRRRKVMSRDLAGRPIVIFRTEAGTVHALAAHCSHMGAHLGHGTIFGDRLRCPLHHWEYDGSGACRAAVHAGGAPTPRQFSYPVAERYGNVFVFNGPEPLYPVPAFAGASEQELHMGTGRRVSIRCPWAALVANGFDMQHLRAVHERALREPPEVEILDPYRIQLRYVSRVTGAAAADRTMKWLSGDHIRVKITCWGGPIVTVESDLGRTRSNLLLGMTPTATGAEVTPVFGVRRTGVAAFDAVRVALSRWLFSNFLEKDVAIMQDMRFHPPVEAMAEQEPLRVFLEFLDRLPVW